MAIKESFYDFLLKHLAFTKTTEYPVEQATDNDVDMIDVCETEKIKFLISQFSVSKLEIRFPVYKQHCASVNRHLFSFSR